MNPKIAALNKEFAELEAKLASPGLSAAELKQLSVKHSQASTVMGLVRELAKLEKEIADLKGMKDDPDLGDMAREELPKLEQRYGQLEHEVMLELVPKDPADAKDCYLEVRQGAGGDEAGLFAAELLRMYMRFAEGKGWKVSVEESSPTGIKGVKQAVIFISGKDVFSWLRHEGGVHRVQRVPATESQGRIHTSTATVAVLPEADEVDVEIDEKDLEISIAASGGPGGQGVNTTNSAVQILHRPSGIIVKCQDERSQIKNKARAMKVLRARLLEREQAAHDAQIAAERRGMVGSGERSEKIRTYNYPQNRVTDHRIGLTLHKLEAVMNGDLEELLTALRSSHQAALLEAQSRA